METKVSSSFRDPSGELYWEDGKLFRQIMPSYRQNYLELMQSGLYDKLVEEELLIPHTEHDWLIEPEIVPFISYPYEWCFSMYKDMALATLRIQRLAMEYGMMLKDASAYNMQFVRGKPTLIDTLSFEVLGNKPWVAYRQFCQHFLAPLALMAHKDIRLGQLMKVYIDGIPLDLTSQLLPRFIGINLQLHLRLHAVGQSKVSKPKQYKVGRASQIGLVNSLERAVKGLKWKRQGDWEDYQLDTSYNDEAVQSKQKIISNYLAVVCASTVWDLGANNGAYSILATRDKTQVVAFDLDPACVEACYQQYRGRLLPLVLDLTNPSPAIGWANKERLSLEERAPVDCILALALVHHLAIGNNVPLGMIAEWLSKLGKWLIIEFVPKEDKQVSKMLASREDIFSSYHEQGFRQVFEQYFRIELKQQVNSSLRTIYLMEKL